MSHSDSSPSFVWLNGSCIPLREASISPHDRGFQFGDGLFETLRAERSKALYLQEHVNRMLTSARRFRLPDKLLEALPWATIISELLARNRLEEAIARIKIIVTRGCASPLCLPEATQPTVLVTSSRYHPPSPASYASGWSAHLMKAGFVSPLSRHKSLNYLIFLVARQEALEHGKEEAILVDPDGRVCETATGSLLLTRDGTWHIPRQRLQLSGITISRAVKLLEAKGLCVHSTPIPASELDRFDGIWTLNSLIGIMPIHEISGHHFPIIERDLIESLRHQLLAGA